MNTGKWNLTAHWKSTRVIEVSNGPMYAWFSLDHGCISTNLDAESEQFVECKRLAGSLAASADENESIPGEQIGLRL